MTRRYRIDVDNVATSEHMTDAQKIEKLHRMALDAIDQREELVSRTGRAIADAAHTEERAHRDRNAIASAVGLDADDPRIAKAANALAYLDARTGHRERCHETYRRGVCLLDFDAGQALARGVAAEDVLEVFRKSVAAANKAFRRTIHDFPTEQDWTAAASAAETEMRAVKARHILGWELTPLDMPAA